MLYALSNSQPIRAGKDALIGMKFVPLCVYCGMHVYLDESEQLETFAWKHCDSGKGVVCQMERDKAKAELNEALCQK